LKPIQFTLVLTFVLISACSLVQMPTPTPTVVGTWEATIEGVIYDAATGLDKPIAGGIVTYEVLHSYFPELQEGRVNQTTSDEGGMFSLRVVVHDTDSIKVVIQAKGYTTYEEKFVGVDLLAGKRLEIGLSP
jgi:hypothetical protein